MLPDKDALDTLCRRSLAGDARAEAALFADLRVSFLPLAKRRVQMDHVEDVVQEALKIVFARYGERETTTGILVWGLTVLRNVIGNYYQARQRERDHLDFVEEMPAAAAVTEDMLAEREHAELRQQLLEAIGELAERFPRCGRIFHSLLTSLDRGGTPNQVSSRALALMQRDHPDLTRGGFYTALHRCRASLRDILVRRAKGLSHV